MQVTSGTHGSTAATVVAAMHALPTLLLFVALPLGDAALGSEETQPGAAPTMRSLATADVVRYRIANTGLAALYIAATALSAQAAAHADAPTFAVTVLNAVLMAANVFVATHDCYHSRSRFDKGLGRVCLTLMCARHLEQAHPAHHANTGLPHDAGSAKLNQTVRCLARPRAGLWLPCAERGSALC